ncbi:Hypp9185 [Branchiostoma lanceolatum]|uniref:Hypp9185 protein n=1 Tax=Branchiostoma lanceolatum TaxID=7740 RepID=A0A8J9ZCK5_BRALA|nr:Hypp9185 [Branchiostoma lanceolatum]
MKNVTCLINTWERTYRHVFSTSVSAIPGHTDCEQTERETQTTSVLHPVFSTLGSTVDTEQQEATQAIIHSRTTTPSPILDKMNPSTIKHETAASEDDIPLYVGPIITIVICIVPIALVVACISRKQSCCSKGNQAAQGPLIASVSSWMVGGPNSHAVTVNNRQLTGGNGTAADTTRPTTDSADENQYNEIPDEYYTYENTSSGGDGYWQIPDEYYNDMDYNTRPASLCDYCEIPDRYFNYENTRPLSLQLTVQDDTVRFYAATELPNICTSEKNNDKILRNAYSRQRQSPEYGCNGPAGRQQRNIKNQVAHEDKPKEHNCDPI